MTDRDPQPNLLAALARSLGCDVADLPTTRPLTADEQTAQDRAEDKAEQMAEERAWASGGECDQAADYYYRGEVTPG